MKINQKGIKLIKSHEGCRLRPYKDVAGKWTIGYGHLIKRGERFGTITRKEATQLLKLDVVFAERAVSKYVKVRLKQNQFNALVSWTFNLGSGSLRASTMLKRLNERAYVKVPGEMLRWVLAGNKPYAGLIRRRAEEAMLFINK